MKKISTIIFALFISALIIACAATSPYPLNTPAPFTKFKTGEDSYVLLDSLKGKTVVVFFWASWCSFSRGEIERLNQIALKYKDDPTYYFVAVSLDTKREDFEAFLTAHNLSGFHHAFSGNSGDDEAAIYFKVSALPQTFVIDPNGIVIGKGSGVDLSKFGM